MPENSTAEWLLSLFTTPDRASAIVGDLSEQRCAFWFNVLRTAGALFVRSAARWPLPITIGTLILFYLIWAAMHDIAHGEQGTLEWSFLAVSVPAFALLYRHALRVLPSKARMGWLIGTGSLISLFIAGSIGAILHPKYPKDPMLGTLFLAMGLPVLALIAFHLVRGSLRKRV